MRNDPFMRTYSPRQESMARAAAQEQQAAATRPASATTDSADLTQYLVKEEPYYHPVSDEVEMYEAAYSVRMPIMLKGPTGCGKTRFVAHMAAQLGRPIYTVACHDDLSAADLIGRYLLKGEHKKLMTRLEITELKDVVNG